MRLLTSSLELATLQSATGQGDCHRLNMISFWTPPWILSAVLDMRSWGLNQVLSCSRTLRKH